LKYVLENGPKWALMAKKFLMHRNQHAVKNRFFSLLSCYTLIPIRKIKKEIEYLNKFLITEALEYHQSLKEEKRSIKEVSNWSQLIDLSNEEFLNYISSPLGKFFDELDYKI
jgi:hypothetical protein